MGHMARVPIAIAIARVETGFPLFRPDRPTAASVPSVRSMSDLGLCFCSSLITALRSNLHDLNKRSA